MKIAELRISVIVTYFRKGELLREALESVSSQLQPGDELVVVDDCSGDGVAATILNEIGVPAGTSHRLLIAPTNEGAAAAKNRGIRASSGDVICLLDADDVLPAGSLDVVRSTFSTFPEADFVYGDYRVEDRGASRLVSCLPVTTEDGWLDVSAHFKNWRVLGSTPFRSSVVRKIGFLDASRPRTDDVDWQTLAMSAGLQFRYAPQLIYVWRRQATGNSRSRGFRDNLRSTAYRAPLVVRASDDWPSTLLRMATGLALQALPAPVSAWVRRTRTASRKQ